MTTFPIYGKITNVPNHQPGSHDIPEISYNVAYVIICENMPLNKVKGSSKTLAEANVLAVDPKSVSLGFSIVDLEVS